MAMRDTLRATVRHITGRCDTSQHIDSEDDNRKRPRCHIHRLSMEVTDAQLSTLGKRSLPRPIMSDDHVEERAD
jgi:hypothetical protein